MVTKTVILVGTLICIFAGNIYDMDDLMQYLFPNDGNTVLNGRLWLQTADGERFFGPGPITLLELIVKTGSISKAAAEMKMSYKKAWLIVNNLNARAVHPIVIPQAGGEKGGGSEVTRAGLALISYYRGLTERFREFLAKENKDIHRAIAEHL